MRKEKAFKTIDEQIALLKARNVKITDDIKAKQILVKYNYFDLINGSENILLSTSNPKLYENVYFDDFIDIFNFDNELKTNTLFYIFDIEARLKTSIAYHFAEAFCSTIKDTLNYTNKNFYEEPPKTSKYLYSTFHRFDLFKQTIIDKNGVRKPGFIDKKKKEKSYIGCYKRPPFWITIKDFSLGELSFTYCFLKPCVKEKVLHDFGFSLSNDFLFQQIIYVLKEARNNCAHLELITCFKFKGSQDVNKLYELKQYLQISKVSVHYYDIAKLLAQFSPINKITNSVSEFERNMYLKNRTGVCKKVLKRMGEIDISKWQF